jgi:hypothetical protein
MGHHTRLVQLISLQSTKLTGFVSGFITVGPPILVCADPDCRDKRGGYEADLGHAQTFEAILFTKSYGPLPIFPSSFYCQSKFAFIHK